MKERHTLSMETTANTNTEKHVSQPREVPSVKQSLTSFLGYTTAHGCGRLAVARGMCWRMMWVIFCITAHVLFWFHFIIIVQEYMKKPIRTRVSMQRNKVLDFPVVTICNRNMLRQSKITQEMTDKIENISNETSSYWKKIAHADSDLLHLMHNRLQGMRNTVSKLHPSTLQDMGHQFKDMVLDCIIDGDDCRGDKDDANKAAWRHIWIEDVGNCYMFNRVLPKEGKVSHKTMLTGDRHGLRLLINLEQDEYLNGISPYAGMKVVVGAQGEMPFPLSQGINVGPGLTTGIALVMKQSLRMDPFHNRSCEPSENLDPSNMYYKYNMSYTKMACRLSCLSNMQIRRCQCSLIHFADEPNIEYCVLSNITVDTCIDGVRNDFIKGSCDDHCPPQCLDTDFSRTVSTYKWPANQFKSELIRSLHSFANLSMTTAEINDNLLELHIYYANMDYEVVEETLKYAFEDLISNIGGQMGMWIGLSALTIGEVFELIGIIIWSLLHKEKHVSASP